MSALLIGFAISCVDREFDIPPQPVAEIPFAPNATIAELKARYVTGKFVTIADELLLHAIVVADDRSGNFYKTIVIQDSTGGIELKLNRTGLYAQFPVGMKIGIRCSGLTIGDYNGLIQLGQGTYQSGGTTSLAGIEDILIDQYIYPGPRGHQISPRVRTVNSLTAQDLSTLVQLEHMEFVRGELGKSFADVAGQRSSNLLITDCSDNQIILRTSNYADFAAEFVPEGNGSITCILGKYRTDAQLFIRDLEDIHFDGPNCQSSGGNLKEMAIRDVRTLYSGATLQAPDSTKIIGTVISDRVESNITSKNVVLQDASAGIVVRFLSSNTFDLGDLVELDISRQEISEYQGLLQLNNLDISRAKKLGTNDMQPRRIAIADLLADFEMHESTLLLVEDATIGKAGGTNYSGTCTLTDATGSIDLFTQSYASFAGMSFPVGKVSVVGIAGQGGNLQAKQLSIRKPDDVSGGSQGGAELIGILDLRHSYPGSTTAVSGNKILRCTVISDRTQENTTGRNAHVQDQTGGIVLRFTANHTYSLGDSIEVDISGQEFTEFQGLLEINNLPSDRVKTLGKGGVTPKTFDVAGVLANFEDLESTLVQIEQVGITKVSGATYSGTCLLEDGTGQMDLYTRTAALFANENFPAGKVRLVGIVNQGGAAMTMQISIRSTADVQP